MVTLNMKTIFAQLNARTKQISLEREAWTVGLTVKHCVLVMGQGQTARSIHSTWFFSRADSRALCKYDCLNQFTLFQFKHTCNDISYDCVSMISKLKHELGFNGKVNDI